MKRRYSLSFLTVADLQPPEAIRVAARTGYHEVGLRLLPAAASGEAPYPIFNDRRVLAQAQQAIEETGIGIADVEIVRLKPETEIAEFLPFLECAAALGASKVLVAGDDTDHSRLTQTFAAFAELAGRYGMTADLEFMPWTGVRDAVEANAIVQAADQPAGGVLADALHWDRTGGRKEDLLAIPHSLIHYIQICDGPLGYDPSDSGLIRIARGGRLMPGDGGIDLATFLRVLPKDVPISVEIASLELNRRMTADERAATALRKAKEVVARSETE
ncbi:sugar phosphate isomerase/epimerase family protein [Rhizobium halophilum]|uniref:sugar phosphate isomerase/epimerase family protein n=1 Tax=Rhizobium halophilum TaxID=2846852 RepID=UPI001EFD3CFE|nr:sugar phosphate isomerase/epimerase [Rhizobium halophilum]MCF6370832.1 sugar phosphate isomerase/epimerase [Rhizobium halophilum]